jgi:hypothetical protein
MLLYKLKYKEYLKFLNRLYFHNLVWNSLRFLLTASRFINRKLPQTKLYSITCSNIEHIFYYLNNIYPYRYILLIYVACVICCTVIVTHNAPSMLHIMHRHYCLL